MTNLNLADFSSLRSLADAHYPSTSEAWLKNGAPTPDTWRESIRRTEITADVAAALTTQVMLGVAVALNAGDVVTKIAFSVGATAAVSPTNAWVALYDTNGNLLAQSADSTNTAIGANTNYEGTLSAAQTIPVTGIYTAAFMNKGTVPSLLCKVLPTATASGGTKTGQVKLAATSGAALTTTAPATWATPTAVVNVPYCIVS